MGGSMARVAKELKALEVARIKDAGYHAVGAVPGLHLNVTDGGSRSWILRVVVGGKRREIGLGSYPSVTLAKAHEKARETREAISKGVDPIEQKKARKSALMADQMNAVTFEQAALAYIKAIESGWRNPKHGAQWHSTLRNYAYPVIGKLLIRDVATPHVVDVLTPIWNTKNETASRLRGRIEAILNWAKTKGHRTGENPARWHGHLENLLAAPSKVQVPQHRPAVQVAQAGAFMRDLRSKPVMGAKALELLMLTGARSGEVLGARWPEFDLKAKLWTVPGERMKGGVTHRKALSDAAITLLMALPRMADSDLVFPSPRGGGTLSDMALSKLMKSMNYRDHEGRSCVPHGLRSTFRDWAGERTGHPPHLAEMALAHINGDKVESAYARSELLEKRARLMADWAAFLDRVETSSENVLPIRGPAVARG